MHNSILASNMATRKDLAKVLERQIKMDEDLQTNTGYSEAAAAKVKASDMNDEDIALLGLKWTSIDQAREAVNDPEKRQAILRVLNSGIITNKQAHVVSEAVRLFFSEYLVNHMVLKAPAG